MSKSYLRILITQTNHTFRSQVRIFQRQIEGKSFFLIYPIFFAFILFLQSSIYYYEHFPNNYKKIKVSNFDIKHKNKPTSTYIASSLPSFIDFFDLKTKLFEYDFFQNRPYIVLADIREIVFYERCLKIFFNTDTSIESRNLGQPQELTVHLPPNISFAHIYNCFEQSIINEKNFYYLLQHLYYSGEDCEHIWSPFDESLYSGELRDFDKDKNSIREEQDPELAIAIYESFGPINGFQKRTKRSDLRVKSYMNRTRKRVNFFAYKIFKVLERQCFDNFISTPNIKKSQGHFKSPSTTFGQRAEYRRLSVATQTTNVKVFQISKQKLRVLSVHYPSPFITTIQGPFDFKWQKAHFLHKINLSNSKDPSLRDNQKFATYLEFRANSKTYGQKIEAIKPKSPNSYQTLQQPTLQQQKRNATNFPRISFHFFSSTLQATKLSFLFFALGLILKLNVLIVVFLFALNCFKNLQALRDQDFSANLKLLRGSQNTKNFSDLVGVENIRPDLDQLILSIRFWKQRIGKKNNRLEKGLIQYAPKGFLFTGHPGTGKTLIARAIAGEANIPFFYSSGSEYQTTRPEEGLKTLRALFKLARKLAPSIIFIDEIDFLGKARSSIQNDNSHQLDLLTEFLTQVDGFLKSEKVILIGTTNSIKNLDPAFLRPGRFDRIFQFNLPAPRVRLKMLKSFCSTSKFKHKLTNSQWSFLQKSTNQFSGGELQAIVNESLLKLIREKKQTHSFETLMHGFRRMTTYSQPTSITQFASKDMFRLRQAYHYGGIGFLATYLQKTPGFATSNLDSNFDFLELAPRQKNFRYIKRDSLNYKELTNFEIIETEILNLLAGPAAQAYIFYLLQPKKVYEHLKRQAILFSDSISAESLGNLEQANQRCEFLLKNSFQIPVVIREFLSSEDLKLVSQSLRKQKIVEEPFVSNASQKRFSELEIDFYSEVEDSLNSEYLETTESEQQEAKANSQEGRFFSHWMLDQVSSASLDAEQVIKEKNQSTSQDFLDINFQDYFYLNFLETSMFLEYPDLKISNLIKYYFLKVLDIYDCNHQILDNIAYSLLTKTKISKQEFDDILSRPGDVLAD